MPPRSIQSGHINRIYNAGMPCILCARAFRVAQQRSLTVLSDWVVAKRLQDPQHSAAAAASAAWGGGRGGGGGGAALPSSVDTKVGGVTETTVGVGIVSCDVSV